MLQRATWQHLRIPFSIFLLPIFLFAYSYDPFVPWQPTLIVFVVLHLLVYPASNGYNSYFDKDEGSIGGVEKPLPVSKELYWVSLVMDAVAILLSWLLSWQLAVMVFVYGLISKAYSHPVVRLKKHPILGWLVVGAFQGYFTWWLVWQGLHGWQVEDFQSWGLHFPAILSSVLLWGSYPMTQVYQHEEDRSRGDITISLRLGVTGTFHFVAAIFGLSSAGYVWLFYKAFSPLAAVLFLVVLLPVLIYFGAWYFRVRKNEDKADFKSTMRLNLLSSVMMIVYFVGLALFQHLF